VKALSKLHEILKAVGAHRLDPESIGRLDDGRGCCYHIDGMRVLASWGGGWDHVSVSAGWTRNGATRVPTYAELESVRRIFWEDHETVVQIHPPISRYVNWNPYVLHLWRAQGHDYPLPPQEFIAPALTKPMTDQAHDIVQDERATGATREQASRARDLEEEGGTRRDL